MSVNMNLETKKKTTRVCVGLFFLLGGIEYGKQEMTRYERVILNLLFFNLFNFSLIYIRIINLRLSSCEGSFIRSSSFI